MIVDKYVDKSKEMWIVYLCIIIPKVINIINTTSSSSLSILFKRGKIKYNNIWLIKSGKNWDT